MKAEVGKMMVAVGAVLAVVGLALWKDLQIPLLGRLPGDFHFKGDGYDVYVPLATSLLVSAVISLILLLFRGR
jgi:hypothetical protein